MNQPSNRALSSSAEPVGRAGWLLVFSAALLLRCIVLASGTVSFHSDEAVVALMARHVNQGLPIPTFFYGQHYMGSLDALLVALGFRLLGESVLAIRVVESILYLLIVVTTVLLARQISRKRLPAIAAGLLVAIPPVVMTLYTTMTLGGYGETLLLGNLVWMLGWSVTHDRADSWWRWLLLGLLGGLGWWTNALIAVYLVPVALTALWQFRGRRIGLYALALAAFFLGGAPWWIYNLNQNWLALSWLMSGSQSNNGLSLTAGERALGFTFVGLPAALGIRFPWRSDLWAGLLGVPLILTYGAALVWTARNAISRAGPERFLLLCAACFAVIFIGSAFGTDITGRYLLPLVIPLDLMLACALAALWQRRSRRMALAVVSGVLLFQLAGNALAMRTTPPGLTSQFDPANDFTNAYDQQLIDFLIAHDATLGYGTYWVTFRIAFLSNERVILDAWLPNKLSLIYTPMDRRYPPYTGRVEAAEHPVYVTANLPSLDAILAQRLDQAGVSFQRQSIGPYTVYYALSRKVTPVELGLEALGR